MDELEILIQAILSLKDVTKSKKQIVSELPKLEKALQSDKSARVKIIAGLDVDKSKLFIQSQLKDLVGKSDTPTIKVGLDIGNQNAAQNILNELKDVQTEAVKTGNTIQNALSGKYFSDNKNILKNIQYFKQQEDAIRSLESVFSKYGATVSSVEKRGSNGKTNGFSLSVQSATGEIEKFEYKLKNINSQTKGAAEDWRYVLQNITATDNAVQRLIQSQSKYKDQVNASVITLQSQLDKVKSSSNIGSKPIDFNSNENLTRQYNTAIEAIEKLKIADSSAMATMQANASAEISKLKQMVAEVKNAEYAATELRTKDIGNIKDVQTGNLDKFINQINNSKVSIQMLKQDIDNLRVALSNISKENPQSLTEFLNQFDVAKSKFSSFKEFFKSIGMYNNELDKMVTSWEKQGVYTDELKSKIATLKTELSQVAALGNTAELTKWIENYEKSLSEIDVDPERRERLNKNLKEQISLQNQILQKQKEIANIENKPYNTAKLTELNKIVEKKTEELNKLQQESATMTDLMSSEKQRQYILDNTSKAIEALEVAQKNAADSEQRSYELTQKKATALESQIKTYETINTRASKFYKNNFNSLKNDLDTAKLLGKPEEIDKIRARFVTLKAEIKAAGKEGQTFFQKIIDGAKKFSSWMSLTTIISAVARDIRKMVTNVIELDSAMTNLKKVTDETGTTYNKFFKNTAQQAKDLKIDLADLINQTAEWAKKGYDISQSSIASKASGIYSVVGEVDNATAVQDLTTVIKSYNMAIEDSIDIVDKFNNISNKYSVNAADIGKTLSNSVSSLSIAGNSLDQAIAMGTTITEITGDASEAGNTLKVLSMRLRGASTEIEQIGESTDGMAESTSKLREKILALTNVTGKGGFDIMADADNFKSTYQIMEGISKVWKYMSNVNQAALIEVIAGKQRGNTVAALLTNMSQANNILNDSLNSSGSAMEEYSLYLESIEGKIQGMKTSFESLSATVVDSDFIKGGVDFLTSGINLLDSIIDKFGTIQTLISAIALGTSLKNVGELYNTPAYALSLTKCA